jgi:hypothetical protein
MAIVIKILWYYVKVEISVPEFRLLTENSFFFSVFQWKAKMFPIFSLLRISFVSTYITVRVTVI